MEHGLVTDIAICIIAAWIVAVASHAMRLPLLLAYLAAGFAIGPYGFKWVTDVHDIAIISEIGLSLLLFMIGLEIDLKKMLSAGKVITVTAAVQVLGCFVVGWIVFNFLGPAQNRLEAVYPGGGGGDEQHDHYRQNSL
ncbi:MAG: cation:proton antiporter [Limisphaerales bacterium]